MSRRDDDGPENTEEDAVAADTPGPVARDDDVGRVDRPVRRGSVDLRTRDGEVVHHDEAFVRYDHDAFVVSADQSFPADGTVRYPKVTVAWIQGRTRRTRPPRGRRVDRLVGPFQCSVGRRLLCVTGVPSLRNRYAFGREQAGTQSPPR